MHFAHTSAFFFLKKPGMSFPGLFMNEGKIHEPLESRDFLCSRGHGLSPPSGGDISSFSPPRGSEQGSSALVLWTFGDG